jgi:hypothetical protein
MVAALRCHLNTQWFLFGPDASGLKYPAAAGCEDTAMEKYNG